jgi:hypothetical protein
MGVPAFASTGMLPLGRHVCDLDEFEQVFVFDQGFASSQTRQPIFENFLAARQLLADKYGAGLVERVWIGGGFTTAKLDPGDIDVTFLLSADAWDSLSKSAQDRLRKLGREGFKKLGLSVDGFMVTRRPVALPWLKDGLGPEGADYFPMRGAWDDWWSRDRGHVVEGAPPVLEDAHPVRGYVEVVV